MRQSSDRFKWFVGNISSPRRKIMVGDFLLLSATKTGGPFECVGCLVCTYDADWSVRQRSIDLPPCASKIIPGDWGKVGSGWLAQPLRDGPQGSKGRQNSPVPLAAFARRQRREAGTARQGAMRNRPESSQVARKSFVSGRISVTNAYVVATVDQHGRRALAVPQKGVSQRKDAERRDKKSVRTGKDTGSRQDP
jgi:hypothetical protein